MAALDWYKKNNRLYKDVKIDETAINPDEGLIRIEVQPEKVSGK